MGTGIALLRGFIGLQTGYQIEMEMDCDESERQRGSHVSSSMPSLRASTSRQLSPGPRSASCLSSIASTSLPLWVLKHPLGPLSCHSATT